MTSNLPATTDSKQSFTHHLIELRRCLIRSVIALFAGMGISLYFSKDIFTQLQQPLLRVMPAQTSFIATNPLEGMITYLKVAFLAGIFITSPVILYQVWSFVAPGLYKKERLMAFSFVLASTILFVGGALFGYFVIFPVGFKFFVAALEGTGITFMPRMEDYLSFISKMLLTFGAIFEMPLLLVLLARLGLVRLEALRKARRYVLVVTFLIAGVLTPGPDILSQVLLAVPLLFLYEFSLILIWMMEKKKKKEAV
jgi:sec-independent protein translocase protein TatC